MIEHLYMCVQLSRLSRMMCMIVWGKGREHNKDDESLPCTIIMRKYFYGCSAKTR